MMKTLLFSAIFATIFTDTIAQSNATIGMSIDEVKKIYPQTQLSTYENTITLSLPDTIYGLQGEWGYRFENNKLNWIHFDKYIDEIKKPNFDKCLKATQKLIKDFSKSYGKPDTTITGDTTFIDPYKQHHWGYDVIEARWNNYNGMKIKVEFTFFGGKEQYHFIVIVNYFSKDYPYFD